VFHRAQALWRQKLLLTVAINGLFWTGYSFLARNAWFPLRTPPRTWLDSAISFQPDPWACVYLSQFIVASVLPWMIDTRESLRRYVAGVALMSALSFAVFVFFPVASPRGMDARVVSGAMKLIVTCDGAMNAFPSLHAAFVVFLARMAWRMFRDSLPRWFFLAGAGWSIAILYATIATRQHYAADLIAGGALGALADWFAWRRRPPGMSAATTISRSSGVAFQDGCK
jgi:membrane-associated phospholipid phosphatase